MKIKISLERKEVKDIIKKYVLKEFPINTEAQEVCVTESFGDYKVEIEEKTDKTEPTFEGDKEGE